MQLFARSLTVTLAVLTGCVGYVEEDPTSYEEPASGKSENGEADAGRDTDTSRSDAGRTEARTQEGDDDDDKTGSTAPSTASQTSTCPKGQVQPLAEGLHIREISLYQTIKVALMKDGNWVHDGPVVQGKKSLLRVFVDPLAGYQAHSVSARLTVTTGGKPTELRDERMITVASSDALLDSSFHFELEGTLVGADTTLSVALEELECSDSEGGAATDARFPASDAQALEATAVGTLRVVVVPLLIGGRAPTTTAQELANMRDALLAYYPVPDVEISVREPISGPSTVGGTDSNAWSDLLNVVMRQRRTDAPQGDVYYFGLMQPAATFGSYCQRGCILGLAPQTTIVQASAQIALGASFGDAQTYETMVHELGHAHGRGHSPCSDGGQISGVDPSYPDDRGATVSWGWDSRSNKLMEPTRKDIMGYCQPNWISDYNYSAIYERSVRVNDKALIRGGTGVERWSHVILYDDGRARWGGAVETTTPGGELESADVLDAAGSVIGQTEVVRVPLSDVPTEFLYIPEPEEGWAALRLGDRTLTLSAILPAL